MIHREVNIQVASNDGDEGPTCDSATCLLVPLDVEPMMDHKRHQIRSLKLVVRAQHGSKQLELIVPGAKDRLPLAKREKPRDLQIMRKAGWMITLTRGLAKWLGDADR
jgi:hypothetical protein